MLFPIARYCVIALGLFGMFSSAGAQERRVALVIGNAAYQSVPLQNPVNDSRAISASLRKLGFEVIERQNVGREGFAVVVREFGDKLRGASVGLFYFAGHGLQVKGRNYLVPVDADIAREDEVPYRSFDVNEVLDKMDSARTLVNLVVLDACRNNPFARSFKPAQTGLAQMDAPAGTLIAFATAPGSVAQDGEGSNGLYTGALLKHIAAPGLAVEQMFKRVRVDVVNSSKNQQVPWESSSLNRDFTFAMAAQGSSYANVTMPNLAITATELALDLAFWDAVKDSKNSIDYRAYLEQYPNGRFATLARLRAGTQSTHAGITSNQSFTKQIEADVTVVKAPAQAVAEPTAVQNSVVRWMQGSTAKEVDLLTGAPVGVVSTSPEGLYLAAASAGAVHWIDALRGNVLRSTKVYAAANAQAVSLQFSADGRWLLLGLQSAAGKYFQLIDASNDRVLWERPLKNAQFDTTNAQVLVQNAQGTTDTVRLP